MNYFVGLTLVLAVWGGSADAFCPAPSVTPPTALTLRPTPILAQAAQFQPNYQNDAQRNAIEQQTRIQQAQQDYGQKVQRTQQEFQQAVQRAQQQLQQDQMRDPVSAQKRYQIDVMEAQQKMQMDIMKAQMDLQRAQVGR